MKESAISKAINDHNNNLTKNPFEQQFMDNITKPKGVWEAKDVNAHVVLPSKYFSISERAEDLFGKPKTPWLDAYNKVEPIIDSGNHFGCYVNNVQTANDEIYHPDLFKDCEREFAGSKSVCDIF
jgi:hypothetical protein